MEEHSPKQSKILAWFIDALIVIALAIKFYILYFPYNFYKYLVPPGGDIINHLGYVKSIMQGHFSANYPFLFHAIIAFFSETLGVNPLEVMKWGTPVLVVLPALSLYFFAKHLFGIRAAIITFFIALWLANYSLIAFGDGNYPNLLAGGFFQPIAFTFVVLALTKSLKNNIVWVVLLSLLIALTHHLTVALYLAVLLVYLIVLMIFNGREKITLNVKKTLYVICASILAAIVVIYLSPVRTLFSSAIGSFLKTGSVLADKTFAKPLEFSNYPEMIGGFVWYIGLVAIVYLVIKIFSGNREGKDRPAILLILTWFAVVYLFSMWAGIGLPARIAREAALPLMLAIGYGLSDLIALAEKRYQRIIVWGVLSFILVTNLQQINNGVYGQPEFFNKMVWFDQNDLEKAKVLKGLTIQGERIFANPTTPYMKVFTERDVVYPELKSIPTTKALVAIAKSQRVRIIFVGTKTSANPDEKVYPDFAGFKTKTAALSSAASSLKVVEKFPDGSTIYEIEQ